MKDDLVYGIALTATLGVTAASHAVAHRASIPRRALAAATGFALAALASPSHLVHVAVQLAVTRLLMLLFPRGGRTLGAACAAFTFGYLAVLRLSASVAGPANALQLVLTLKLTSVGFDAASGGGALAPATTLDLVQYCFCFFGLFTGPFYSFSEWARAMEPLAAPAAADASAAVRRRSLRALMGAVLALGVWQGSARLFPFSRLQDADSYLWSFGRRLAYFYISSFQFRHRFYFVWYVMEAAGELARFPHPSNVDALACETATSTPALIARWNVSVHRFLRDYVYLRVPLRSRATRRACTFLVSAFWHGIHPGYYIFFSGLFMTIVTENLAEAAFGGVFGGAIRDSAAASVARHLWTMGLLTYFGAAFNLLQKEPTLRLWSSLYSYGFWALAIVFFLSTCGLLFNPRGAAKRKPS